MLLDLWSSDWEQRKSKGREELSNSVKLAGCSLFPPTQGVTGRCCGTAVAHQRAINLGSKGVEIQKEASARCLT
ncbi:hypothetical protein AMECASPLE_011360, partial [Ameca splendens]